MKRENKKTNIAKTKIQTVDKESPYKSELGIFPVVITLEPGWNHDKDTAAFNNIWGNEIEGSQCEYDFIILKIASNLDELGAILKRAARFLSPGISSHEAMDALYIDGKVDLLRKLIVEHIAHVRNGHERNYLFRMNEDLDRIQQVEVLRRMVLVKYMLNPGETWLSELVQLADWITSAGFSFQDSMRCEHKKYRMRRPRGTSDDSTVINPTN